MPFLEDLHHLVQATRAVVINQVVRQDDSEGLIANDGLGTPDGVPQSQCLRLSDVYASDIGRYDILDNLEDFRFSPQFKFVFKFVSLVEMVGNGPLAASSDEHKDFNACGNGFLHGILDQWFVHHRQHFLGVGLGRREESGTHAGHWEDSFFDGFFHCYSPLSLMITSRYF